MVLNAARQSRHVQVPHWNGGGAIDDQYGSIRIENGTASPIIIYSGADLIENAMYTDDIVENYSTIPANDNISYLMPIDTYVFSARHADICNNFRFDNNNYSRQFNYLASPVTYPYM